MITRVKPDESRRIDIFYEGDENVTEVCFENPDKDLKWVLNYFRRGDKRPYSVPLREEEDNLIWTVTLADTARPGMGVAQLVGSGKDQTKHSGSYSVFVGKSLVNPGDVPAVDKAFLDKVAKEAAEAQTAAENTKTLYNRIQAGLADGSFRGEKGEKGERGEQGAAGPTGPAGERGPEGKQGPIGPTGPQGPQGIQGEQGPIGPAGPTGPKGDQGERGLTGDTGPTGPKGDTGPQGVPGAKGEKGDTGPAGADGKDGLDAPQIDDTVVSGKSPWSSRKIIETLCPPFSETGNPVTCEPVAGYPLGVVASWEPKQEGTGDPYPAGGGPNLLDISKCTAGFTPYGYGITTAISGDLLTIKGTAATTSATASFVAAMTPDTSLSGKGYKVTAFPAKGSITNVYGLRTEDETAIAVVMPLTEGTAVDVALRIMVSKNTPTAYAPYENIRPISGRDAVSVERCGANLFDQTILLQEKECTEENGIYTFEASSVYTLLGEKNGLPIRCKDGQRYTLSYYIRSHTADVINARFEFLYSDGSNSIPKLNNTTNFEFISVTSTRGKTVVGVRFGYNIRGTVSVYNICIREATGTQSDTAYLPYRGDNYNLALPQTVYGGTVDAVTGAGAEEWGTYFIRGTEFMSNQLGGYDNDTTVMIFIGALIGTSLKADKLTIKCNRIPPAASGQNVQNKALTGWLIGVHPSAKYADYLYIRMPRDAIGSEPTDTSAEVPAKAKAWFAAQYAAGTPVQIAYRLAKPVPFQATGNGPLLPIPGETNTVMTDADSVTVTGRADPIRIIQQLQAAQSTAAVQIAETQQAVVDTTAMAVDYIYEQDSQIFGGDDNDSETDAVPT